MPYFFLIPALAAWLALALLAVLACRLWARPLLPYAWRIGVWGSLGFLIANLLIVAIGLGTLRLSTSASGVLAQAMSLLAAGMLFIGPFVASAVGWGVGVVVGLVLAFRARRKPPNNSFKPTPLRGSA